MIEKQTLLLRDKGRMHTWSVWPREERENESNFKLGFFFGGAEVGWRRETDVQKQKNRGNFN